MKCKILTLSAALVIYLAGVLSAITISFGVGDILAIMAYLIVFVLYCLQLYHLAKDEN